jgi:hypothetical protein
MNASENPLVIKKDSVVAQMTPTEEGSILLISVATDTSNRPNTTVATDKPITVPTVLLQNNLIKVTRNHLYLQNRQGQGTIEYQLLGAVDKKKDGIPFKLVSFRACVGSQWLEAEVDIDHWDSACKREWEER